ncbi:MAG TPA: sigma-70 family RNA polymerase sigma factor [Bacteroidales bacterium]|nr:sigma-70 family RNA polymerase sigma factor [Bacteroidales bacterium]
MADDIKYIVQECLAGKRQAQEKLYAMFSAKMFGVCLRYCKNYDEAKDVLQEGFVKVFSKLEQFSFSGSFEGWIRRIVVNTAIEKLRAQTHNVPLDFAPEVFDEIEEDEMPLISAAEMLSMVQELPTQYKMVFNLYVFEKLPHKEIAEMLGITEGGSKSNLSRARAILQEKVKSKMQKRIRVFGT